MTIPHDVHLHTYNPTLRVIKRLGDKKASKKAIYKILTMQTALKENSPSTHNDFVSLLLGDEYHIVSYRIVSYRILPCRIVSYRIVSYQNSYVSELRTKTMQFSAQDKTHIAIYSVSELRTAKTMQFIAFLTSGQQKHCNL